MKYKILVVDDEEDLELLLKQKYRMQIRSGKVEFSFAVNGLKAMDLLKVHNDYHVVITDLNMPGLDGFGLISKAKEEYPHLKFVVLSAYGDPSNVKKAMEKGAVDFITKPINFRELDETLRDVLGTAL